MSPEVLIYIRTVKDYFKKNDEVRDYFLTGVDEELFFKYLADISQKNFDKNGEVMLNVEQFELLKKTIRAVTISKKEETNDNIFFEINGYGKICLN